MKDVKRKFVCPYHALQLHRIKLTSSKYCICILFILQNRQVTLQQTIGCHIKGYVYCNISTYIEITLYMRFLTLKFMESIIFVLVILRIVRTNCIFKCIDILRTLPNPKIWYLQYIMYWLQTRKTMLSMKNCFTNLSANRPCNNIVNYFYTLWRYYMTKRW